MERGIGNGGLEFVSSHGEITGSVNIVAGTPSQIADLLDAQGGVSLSAPVGQSILTLACARLRALDLHDSPDLCVLDLRDAAAELHLTIIGCPQLRTVRLPPHGAAFVHVDGGAAAPELALEGGVEQLDGCWTAGRFLSRAPRGTLWQGACITAVDAAAPASGQPVAALQVLVGTSSCPPDVTLRVSPGVRTMLLVAVDGMQHLVWTGDAADTLEILDAPQLESIELNGALAHLLVGGSPRLSAIRGNARGRQLQVKDGSGTRLELHVDWRCDEMIVADSDIGSLRVAYSCDLQLLRCARLDNVSLVHGCRVSCEGRVPPALIGVARVFVDRGLLKNLEQRCLAGDWDMWRQLRELLPLASDRAHAPLALQVLDSLLAAGLDPEATWRARTDLYARHLLRDPGPTVQPEPRHLARALQSWAWDLPDDLGADAWRADWRIWQGCRGLPAAQDYQVVMARDLVSLGSAAKALVPWLFRAPQLSQTVTNEFLVDLCRCATESATTPNLAASLDPAVASFLRSRRDGAEESGTLVEAAQGYVNRHGSRQAVLEVMADEIERQPTATRIRLLDLIAHPPDRPGSMTVNQFRTAARILVMSGRLPAEAMH